MAIVLVYIGIHVKHVTPRDSDLASYTANIAGYETSAVLPRFMDFRMWDGIVSTKDSLVKVKIDTETAVVKEVARIPKIKDTQVIDKAAETRTAKAVLGFARFPVTPWLRRPKTAIA